MSEQSKFDYNHYQPTGVDQSFLPLLEDGAHCPTCGRFGKIYARGITGAMAYALILMAQYREKNGDIYFHVEDYFKSLSGIPSSIRGDFSKLKHWGLIRSKAEQREDGSRRNGFYRITDRGVAFVHGGTTASKHIAIYNEEFLGFLDDKRVTIEQCLGKKFNYQELMSWSLT